MELAIVISICAEFDLIQNFDEILNFHNRELICILRHIGASCALVFES